MKPKTIDDLECVCRSCEKYYGDDKPAHIHQPVVVTRKDLRNALIERCKELRKPFLHLTSLEGTMAARREKEIRERIIKELMRFGNLKDEDLE